MSGYEPPKDEMPTDRTPVSRPGRPPNADESRPKDASASLVLGEQSKALENTGLDESAPIDDAEQGTLDAIGMSAAAVLQLVRDSETQGTTFLNSHIRPAWERSYRAFRNEHFRRSKYLTDRFKSRSKLFKPKTRSAVRKNMASAAGSLFGNADVVVVTAQDDSDPVQRASAALKKELLNYRLDRANRMVSIPWFLVSMGAHQDAQITGICVSKQYWKYQERPSTGEVIVDRPDVLNIPPEHIVINPNCEWTDAAQTSNFLQVRYPMAIHEIRARMESGEWLNISKEDLESFTTGTPQDIASTRRARDGGPDAAEEASGLGDYRIIWVYENFQIIHGEDYTFWSLGTQRLLTVPACTHEVYPEQFGQRPYVIGLGALETHRPLPMAPVESWQQLQHEANEVINLRLDQMKHVVNPPAKVARGKMVDIALVQRRAPDTVIPLTDPEKDVVWDRPPDVPPSAYQEGNYINNDFDELSGSFSTSSVQSNRSLNETVGGMRLLSSAATTVTEFDLKVWIETWVDRVLAQVLKLEEYYESDERVLVLCGQRAELAETFNINEITDQLLMQDVTVKVSAGIGAGDPMQALGKFGQALQILQPIFQGAAEMGMQPPQPNFEEIVDEVLGKAGYKHAFDRFFQSAPPPQAGQQGPTPADQVAAAKVQSDAEQKEKDRQAKMAMEQMKLQDKGAERQHKAQIEMVKRDTQLRGLAAENLRTNAQIAHTIAEAHANRHQAAQQARQDRIAAVAGENRQAQFAAQQADADRAHQAAQSDAERAFSAEQSDYDRAHQAEQAQLAAKAKAQQPTKKAA